MKACLVGSSKESVKELSDLCEIIGWKVVKIIQQKIGEPTSFYLRKGKFEELQEFCSNNIVDMVVFDTNLEIGQRKNIKDALKTEVFDRSDIVLKVFEEHMKDPLGELQIKYIKTKRTLPFISDDKERGHTNKRLKIMKTKIEKKKAQFNRVVKNLLSKGYLSVAFIGYTNAGKSSLFNHLAKRYIVEIDERLFTTLRATTRIAKVKGFRVILIDTIGIFDNLPHELIPAFESTMYAAFNSDVIILMLDLDSPIKDVVRKMNASMKFLKNKKCEGKIRVVLNKIDLVDNKKIKEVSNKIKNMYDLKTIPISAKTGENVDTLIDYCLEFMDVSKIKIFLPHENKKTYAILNEIKKGPFKSNIIKSEKGFEVSLEGKKEAVSQIKSKVEHLFKID